MCRAELEAMKSADQPTDTQPEVVVRAFAPRFRTDPCPDGKQSVKRILINQIVRKEGKSKEKARNLSEFQ